MDGQRTGIGFETLVSVNKKPNRDTTLIHEKSNRYDIDKRKVKSIRFRYLIGRIGSFSRDSNCTGMPGNGGAKRLRYDTNRFWILDIST